MIKELQLENFKCFQNLCKFEFSKLNLLTGINGRGKSSLLQSILLLSQTANKFELNENLNLNGKHIDLGDFDDIKNSETTKDEKIFIGIQFDDLSANFYISESESDSMKAVVSSHIDFDENMSTELESITALFSKFQSEVAALEDPPNPDKIELSHFHYNQLIRKVHYVGADRLGPVKYIDKISFGDFISVGSRGEFTLNVLSKRDLPLVNDKLYLGKDSKSVLQQSQEWLSYILDGALIDIKGIERESPILYMLINNKNNSYKYKTKNVGFGYSYVLPLIASGLIAQEGDVIIIENPEAHLHPKAQSRIAEFFAKVASCGVQVFIESHSEHILNGFRVSVLNPEIDIKYDEVAVHYFDKSFDSAKLTIDNKGKIKNWPIGFFDQQDIDISSIFKYSR